MKNILDTIESLVKENICYSSYITEMEILNKLYKLRIFVDPRKFIIYMDILEAMGRVVLETDKHFTFVYDINVIDNPKLEKLIKGSEVIC